MKEFLQQALTALENAKDAVECWSGYASEYFQKKHDLDGDIAGIDADMEKLRVAIDSLTQQDAQPVRAGPCEPAPELPPPEPLTGFDAWLADFTKVNAVTKQWVEGARFVWNMQPVQAEIADLRRQLEDARKALATCETGGYCDVDGDFCKTYWFDEALVKAAINVAMKEQK